MSNMTIEKTKKFKVITGKFRCNFEVTDNIITHADPRLKEFHLKNVSKLMDWLDEYYTDDYRVEKVSNG